MKKYIIALMLLFVVRVTYAQYTPTDQTSTIKFTITNLGFSVDGTFKDIAGNINFNPQNIAVSSFDVSIAAGSVSTGNGLRDEHLKDENYFDVRDHPRITLVSTQITALKNNTWIFKGRLSIKGQTKSVSFPFTATSTADGFIFKGAFKINRRDFDIGGISTISNEVQVALNVTAQKNQSLSK